MNNYYHPTIHTTSTLLANEDEKILFRHYIFFKNLLKKYNGCRRLKQSINIPTKFNSLKCYCYFFNNRNFHTEPLNTHTWLVNYMKIFYGAIIMVNRCYFDTERSDINVMCFVHELDLY